MPPRVSRTSIRPRGGRRVVRARAMGLRDAHRPLKAYATPFSHTWLATSPVPLPTTVISESRPGGMSSPRWRVTTLPLSACFGSVLRGRMREKAAMRIFTGSE